MDQLQLFPRGTTFYGSTPYRSVPTGTAASPYGTSVELEGTIKEFSDVDFVNAKPGGLLPHRSNRMVVCQLVRNVSGVQLQPGMLVQWAPGYRGQRVTGYSDPSLHGGVFSTSGRPIEYAGIVDDWLPAGNSTTRVGVPNHDLFWLVIKGPCYVYTPNGVTQSGVSWGVGDALFAMSASYSRSDFLASASATGAASSAIDDAGRLHCATTAMVGWVPMMAGATSSVAILVAQNKIAVAMEAFVAGSTSAAKRRLVDVKLY
jgi:hypothetical protein